MKHERQQQGTKCENEAQGSGASRRLPQDGPRPRLHLVRPLGAANADPGDWRVQVLRGSVCIYSCIIATCFALAFLKLIHINHLCTVFVTVFLQKTLFIVGKSQDNNFNNHDELIEQLLRERTNSVTFALLQRSRLSVRLLPGAGND